MKKVKIYEVNLQIQDTHKNHKPIPVGDEVEEFVQSFDCPERAKQHLAELEKAEGTKPDNQH